MCRNLGVSCKVTDMWWQRFCQRIMFISRWMWFYVSWLKLCRLDQVRKEWVRCQRPESITLTICCEKNITTWPLFLKGMPFYMCLLSLCSLAMNTGNMSPSQTNPITCWCHRSQSLEVKLENFLFLQFAISQVDCHTS